jgi:hypothetical protein
MIIALAGLPLEAQAFQLTCAHTGGTQTITRNGKTETKRDSDFAYSINIDVDLARKTMTIQDLGDYAIVTANRVQIAAEEITYVAGTRRSIVWTLNRVTGEFIGDSRYSSPSLAAETYNMVTYQCERATPKF